MKKILVLLVLAMAMSGCAQLRPFRVKVVGADTKKATLIISSPAGAKIEINNEYVGEAPVYVEITQEQFFNGAISEPISIVAHPFLAEQYFQRKIIYVGQSIPKKVYFDMTIKPGSTEPE